MILIFEKFEKGKYWSTEGTDPIFSMSLDKLGVPEDDKNKFNNRPEKKRKYKIFLLYFNNSWSWSYSDTGFSDKLKYMGQVELTHEDINNWHIKNDANKYNI